MYLFISDDTSANNHVMASQLHNIRMKLEERRRRIESEKRRIEVVMSKQRQKMGKAAFLQAVTKVSNGNQKKGTYPLQN
jgi:calmodulin-regulated spectrin-associated protein